MSKIVSVTRILNEDDIVEAFIRHHAAHVDHMLFLDNGSSDRTLEILREMQAEGFPLKVSQNPSVSFDEIGANTWSYQVASQILGADWVVFLDADEFIATPNSAPLVTLLPPDAPAITAKLVNYGQTREDNTDEPVVPWRMRWRDTAETHVEKLMLRGGLPNIVVEAGNHGAYSGGKKLAATLHPDITLAHYPRRNGWQIVQKMIAGRLKALAGGRAGAAHAQHYLSPFETLRDKPWEVLLNEDFFAREFERSQAVEEPLAYLGGPLSYWQPSDPAMKAASTFLHFAERLAVQHGRLIDEAPQARTLVDGWNAKRIFLF
ncbi:MAG: glycosyltransferase family 2 protein [Acidocella sp.]|nr:glycosyltransferase family 2 protein [Acidocella sp.]